MSILSNGKCKCFPGYNGNPCSPVDFEVESQVNKNNTITLTFSDDLEDQLDIFKVKIELEQGDIKNCTIDMISINQYLITCDFAQKIKSGTLLYITFINSIISVSNGELAPGTQIENSLYKSIMTAKEKEVAALKNQVSAGASVLLGSSAAAATFNPSPSGL